MYPNLGSGTTQPSAPPPPSSTSTSASLPNYTAPGKQVGFSSLMSQPSAQNTPYPGGQSSQLPYPTGPPSSAPYTSPYPTNIQPPNTSAYSPYSLPNTGQQPPNTSAYSPYSLPNTGQQPPPSQVGGGFHQSPYPQPFLGGQRPPPAASMTNYQNPYQSANPYQPQQGYQNPYQSSNPYQPQQGGYPPNNPQQSSQNPYAPSFFQQPQGGYPQYNQQQSYQPLGGGYNTNSYGGSNNFSNDRLRAIAGKYEINDMLVQRLNILQQFEIVILCDDSGSMNTPVDGTNGTRWDELRSIVQIIIEIGTVFDSNGVDVHFLNRPPILNITNPQQVVESFSQRPQGLTPLTSTLRRIFQTGASKSSNDKRLLVFIATDGAPTDNHGNVDIQSLENLMRNERQSNRIYVTFLACTDDDSSVNYLSQWDRTMINVDVIDDYKSEREEVRRARGFNYPFSFGDYVVKALLGAVDPQMDALDEFGNNNNNNKYW